MEGELGMESEVLANKGIGEVAFGFADCAGFSNEGQDGVYGILLNQPLQRGVIRCGLLGLPVFRNLEVL